MFSKIERESQTLIDVFTIQMTFYTTCYELHYLQELVYNATWTNTPQDTVSTPRQLHRDEQENCQK